MFWYDFANNHPEILVNGVLDIPKKIIYSFSELLMHNFVFFFKIISFLLESSWF